MTVSGTNPRLNPGDIWQPHDQKNEPDGREESIKEASRTR